MTYLTGNKTCQCICSWISSWGLKRKKNIVIAWKLLLMLIDLKLFHSLNEFLFRLCGASGNLRIGNNTRVNFMNSTTQQKLENYNCYDNTTSQKVIFWWFFINQGKADGLRIAGYIEEMTSNQSELRRHCEHQWLLSVTNDICQMI